jgi:hypothetical protein
MNKRRTIEQPLLLLRKRQQTKNLALKMMDESVEHQGGGSSGGDKQFPIKMEGHCISVCCCSILTFLLTDKEIERERAAAV